MRQAENKFNTRFIRKNPKTKLAFYWIAGLVCGTWMQCCCTDSSADLIYASAASSGSILDLFLSASLPLLISGLIILNGVPQLLNPVCFFKAFSFAFVSAAVSSAFGHSAWLVHLLLMFSDLWSCFLLYFFAVRFISGNRELTCASAVGYILTVFLVVCMDYHFIFPLLPRILS